MASDFKTSIEQICDVVANGQFLTEVPLKFAILYEMLKFWQTMHSNMFGTQCTFISYMDQYPPKNSPSNGGKELSSKMVKNPPFNNPSV